MDQQIPDQRDPKKGYWTPEEVLEELASWFSVLQGVRMDLVTPDARLLDDLGVDSLDYMNLALTIGDEFGIDTWAEDVPEFITVMDIARFISGATRARTYPA